MESCRFDLALVGGGLQNALMCLAVLHHRPESRILRVERDRRLGGNHTWSFHTAAVTEQEWPFVEPLVVAPKRRSGCDATSSLFHSPPS